MGTSSALNRFPRGFFASTIRAKQDFVCRSLVKGRNFDKFAVTLEPAAGVEKPSGPMVLLGSL